ncbi:glutamyl aminopeptidase [Anastrepha obliqua]|uniref:glutamyl aminopeptidase n=1 Tax=Anastrepha obliqua TaxID=95512 RepID=UPI002409D448|nr:glutamyl aminopeptidase [Anastrepha obliqua]
MYPQSKVPPVRPRSSLSTDDHHYRVRDCDSRHCRKKPNNAFITLVGFCLVLLVLCAFLLGALIYVGRTIVNEPALMRTAATTAKSSEYLANDQLFSPADLSILRIRTTTDFSTSLATHSTSDSKMTSSALAIEPAIVAASKVLQKLSFRLPKEIRPKQYNLRLTPDLINKTYQGSIKMKLEVLSPISYIPVHAKKLNVITEEVVQLSEGGAPLAKLTPTLTFAHPELEYWVTEFKDPLEIGNYSLQLTFNGSLTDRIVGFYASSYLDSKTNERRWIATTKFEPTYARTAFPCFDEPALKATFIITVARPTDGGYHALSNMPIQSEVVNGNITEVTFAESVPMSTYLACVIVSDFTSQSKTVNGTATGTDDFEMRVFATSNQIEKVTYALETGVGITEYYIEYFNVSYPLPKLDMAAIPDFVSGAMEHWGLVTYRETALLYDPTISSSTNKQRVATVVAHELAHMWFGNLVTMKWWNDLWLNEGFASYIEYKGVNKMHPEWDMLDQFIVADLHGVLDYDSSLASHPIVQTVESPAQITELFDTITYSKGAAVIRMLEDLVGEETFRNATTNYLEKYYYGNAETDDYFTEIEALVSDSDIKLIMQTWTEQMGLPVVEVQKDGNTYTLTQKRFLSNPESYNATFEESKFNYHWSIPITYFTSDNSSVERTIFNYNDNEVKITLSAAVDWIKFNKNQVGYYRVNYAPEQWLELTNALINARGQFSNADRAHLINDVFALAAASQLDYSIALNFSTYLEKELDYVPWSVASSSLGNLRNLLYYTDSFRDFVVFVRKLLVNAYQSVTWEVSADHLDNLLRIKILNLAGNFGYEPMLTEASTRFTAWLNNSTDRPDPDIRSAVYYYGMQTAGDEKSWDQVWELFINETDAQEKVKLMEALSAVNSPWILQRYINLAWNESYVRGQDYFTCLSYISTNPIGQSLVWDYVRENWLRLVERFGINERYLGRLIPTITRRFVTQTKLEEMEAFFAKYPEAGAGTTARKQALETVKFNINWLQQNKEKIAEWLATQ